MIHAFSIYRSCTPIEPSTPQKYESHVKERQLWDHRHQLARRMNIFSILQMQISSLQAIYLGCWSAAASLDCPGTTCCHKGLSTATLSFRIRVDEYELRPAENAINKSAETRKIMLPQNSRICIVQRMSCEEFYFYCPTTSRKWNIDLQL